MFKDVLARRYAKAFFESQPNIEKVIHTQGELDGLAALFESSHAIRVFMLSPGFSLEEKISFIHYLGDQKGWQSETKDFLRLLIENSRFRYLKEVVQALGQLIDEAEGRKRVKILTAKSLSDTDKNRVRDRMREIIGQEVEVSVDVSPALIGGLSVQIGSRVFDGSLRGKMESLTERLVKGV